MNRMGKRNIILLSLILVVILLSALFTVAILRSAEIRAALEDAYNRYEEEKKPTTTTAPQAVISTDGGYKKLGKGAAASMMVHYFSDDTFYGRGLGQPLSTSVGGSALSLLHRALTDTYAGGSLSGRIPNYTGNVQSTSDMLYDFNGSLGEGWDIRLSILVPSDATIAKNSEDASLSGNAGTDIEALIRELRASAPYCDILLAVPHNASDTLADAILAIGAHYGLVTVDLRPIGRTAGMVHTEGDDIGYPTAEGHRAIAERIAAAIAEAVDAGREIPELPQTKLY